MGRDWTRGDGRTGREGMWCLSFRRSGCICGGRCRPWRGFRRDCKRAGGLLGKDWVGRRVIGEGEGDRGEGRGLTGGGGRPWRL